MKAKQIIVRMLSMCPEAWYIFIRTLQLCCFLHFCSYLLLLQWNGSMAANYSLYMTAISLQETAQAVLLVSVLLSAFIEDYKS